MSTPRKGMLDGCPVPFFAPCGEQVHQWGGVGFRLAYDIFAHAPITPAALQGYPRMVPQRQGTREHVAQ